MTNRLNQAIIQISDIPMKSNPMDVEAARAAAKRLFQKVNFSGGNLQSYEISSLLTDTYEYLNIPFKPNSRDIKAYTDVLDANKDGQVSLQDLETVAVEYLCGPGVLNQQSFDQPSRKHLYQPQGSSVSTFSQSQQQTTSNSQKQIPTSNLSHWQPRSNKFDEKALNANTSSVNYNPSSAPSSNSQTATSISRQAPQRDYNQQTQHYLSLTMPIFQRHATSYNTITADRVPSLLAETYEILGRKGYKASGDDVEVWMRLCDQNGDGHVEYEQYCKFVVGSMERSGFNVYK